MSTRHQVSFWRGVDKDMKQFLREEVASEWDIGQTKNSHLRLQHRATGAVAYLPANHGDRRLLHNARATLRRVLMAQAARRA